MRGRFELGRYWIDHVPGSPKLYRFWYDAGAGEIRRRSLKTADIEGAKIALAAIVLNEGSGKPSEPNEVSLVAVLTRYWTEHCDKLRSGRNARQAGELLLDYLGNDAKVGAFNRARQKLFLRHLREMGYSIGTLARLMTLIQAALNRATAEDEDDGSALLLRAPKILYSAKAIAAELGEAEPEPRNWHPDLAMVAEFLNGLNLPKEEPLRRFIVLKVAFACRSEAAIQAGPFLLDKRYGLIRLNPPGRRQTKKHRPTLPVPDCLWLVLEEWSDSPSGSFVNINGRRPCHLTRQWNTARDRIGLPAQFIPNSLRHFMATELRHAHLRYGVERVPEDEREMYLGHRRNSVHNSYGAFEPDYLQAAKQAVEAILLALNAQLKQPVFRQVSAKSVVRKERTTHLKPLTINKKGV